MKLKVGIVGFGYWGPKLARNFHENELCEVTAISDVDSHCLEKAKELYPHSKCFTDSKDLLCAEGIQAVVVATPIPSHYHLVKEALLAGKHVLVEKPITDNRIQAEELSKLATENGLTLMVDQTFLYTAAVRKIKSLFDEGSIGSLKQYVGSRLNSNGMRKDCNVLWDLAPHDLSIISFIAGNKVVSVKATASSSDDDGINGFEDIAQLQLDYDDGLTAQVNYSWSAPEKERQTFLSSDEKMLLYDDVEPHKKIKIVPQKPYDESVDDLDLEQLSGKVNEAIEKTAEEPILDDTEALKLVVSDFVTCIKMKVQPLSDALMGIEIIAVLEAAQRSLENQGKQELVAL